MWEKKISPVRPLMFFRQNGNLRKNMHGFLQFFPGYGFRGVINKWFSSYLIAQSTQIGPHVSSRVGISCGVPQGCVLDTLLFLLHIDDIYVPSDKLSTFYMQIKILNLWGKSLSQNCANYIF